MELDSIFATAIRSLFKLGHELFGLQSLAEKGFLSGGNARATINALRRCVADVTAALDGIERQIEYQRLDRLDAKWPK